MTGNPPSIEKQFSLADFKSLLGADWDKLHPDIQKRFSLAHCHQNVTYRGVMDDVYMSATGKLLAWICRLLGTPLSYCAGKSVPTEVRVYPNKLLGGMMWDRFYHFPNRRVNRVRSTKVILPEVGLIEIAISGFGMYSKVYAREGAIVFESKRFFFTLAGRKFPIPHLLSPGKTIATQRALSGGQFEFTLDIRHSVFGQVFKQCGTFTEVGNKPS